MKTASTWLMGVCLVCVCASAIGCNGSNVGDAPAASQTSQPLSLGFSAAKRPTAKLKIGESCTAYEGNSACEGELCLRIAPGFPPKGFCTLKCPPGDDSVCPDGPGPWRCTQVFPSADGWACVPDQSHVSAVATRKGSPVPPPPRRPASPEPSKADLLDGGAR